ncbi:hypothetical protein LG52_93 [Geobacillus kaustophilus]|uniref:Uncharacterized protein n=1 Tax=Geobacillus kaustophilus TaxID=1462 RepID=A0A0D8BN67_GEOKU|nr:hypothetical protein LG52_93 [Geobacillus kaustophilus]
MEALLNQILDRLNQLHSSVSILTSDVNDMNNKINRIEANMAPKENSLNCDPPWMIFSPI